MFLAQSRRVRRGSAEFFFSYTQRKLRELCVSARKEQGPHLDSRAEPQSTQRYRREPFFYILSANSANSASLRGKNKDCIWILAQSRRVRRGSAEGFFYVHRKTVGASVDAPTAIERRRFQRHNTSIERRRFQRPHDPVTGPALRRRYRRRSRASTCPWARAARRDSR